MPPNQKQRIFGNATHTWGMIDHSTRHAMHHSQLLILLLLAPFLSGCLAVSMHSARPVKIRVTERDTGKPVSRALVEIDYDYTGYGVFYILRVPKADSATTDDRGIATLQMADFMASTIFKVNLQHFYVEKNLIRLGGLARGDQSSRPGVDHFNEHPLTVELIPKQ